MTTLALLKAEVSDDLDRPDLLTTSIPSEITKAITYYQNTRFWFNETRDCVIATVADQRLYADEDVEGVVYRVAVDDDGVILTDDDGELIIFEEGSDTSFTGDNLADFIEVDQVILEGEGCELDVMSPKEWEILTASGQSTGKPTAWCYYGGAYGLYPIPDAQYAVRFIGHVKKAAPAADGEANNVWMIHAYDLIRARVASILSLRKNRDFEMAQARGSDERAELNRLSSETASKVGTGFFIPTEF